MAWLYLSAGLMALTALVHTLAGEKRLVGPMLALKQGVMASLHGRKVMRGAWHLTSGFMLVTAAVMVWPDTSLSLKTFVAAFWCLAGLYSLISSRGKHIGWPVLLGSGVAGILGSLT